MKTKEIPFSNKATEVEKGVWEWTTGKTKWRFLISPRINLQVWNEKEQRWQPVCYCRDHREAGCFAEGFAAATEVNDYKDYIVKE